MSAGGPHLVPSGPNRTKRWWKSWFVLCLSQDVHLLLPADVTRLGSQAFSSDWHLHL